MESGLGKSAKIEFLRRVLPLSLGVLAIVGSFYFMSPLSSLVCLLASGGIYAALPRPTAPSGAIRPVSRPSIQTLDAIGFGIGIVFFPVALLGMANTSGALALLSLSVLLPASMAFLFFAVAVRQETSWVRFFGNGFEFTQFGRRARVPYEELKKIEVRLWEASGWVAWFQSTIGSIGHKKAVLLNGAESTKTLVFQHPVTGTFTISSELIPDLQRILIGMDRAGIDLPEGISEWQRKKIRRRRERMYGGPEPEGPKTEQVEVARIAALIEHARRQATP